MNVTVVKVGGKVIEDETSLDALLKDFSSIAGNKILVHGGGKLATTLSERLGVETKMVDGRRITDAQTLDVVTMVYAGLCNKKIVAKLQKRNVNAIGFSGADLDLIRSKKRAVKDIDYGFVGDVTAVESDVLLTLFDMGATPVISPITHDGKGQLLNTNADTIASEVACSLARSQCNVTLMYCFEKPGVLSDANDDKSVIPSITYEEFKQYQEEGVISEGMIPKLDTGFDALKQGVKYVVITDVKGVKGIGGTRLEL